MGAGTQFDWLVAQKLTITGNADVVGTTTLATANVTTGNLTTANITTAEIGGDLSLDAATVITLTSGATLTPNSSYQPIAAAGNIGFGAIAAGAEGDLLTVINVTNTTITITDTGTLKLSGNLALGQYDSATLLSDGTNWIQLATSNN
jgi:hypothetical protein